MRHLLLTVILAATAITNFTGCDQSEGAYELGELETQVKHSRTTMSDQNIQVIQSVANSSTGFLEQVQSHTAPSTAAEFAAGLANAWAPVDFKSLEEQSKNAYKPPAASLLAAKKCAQYPVPKDGTVWMGNANLNGKVTVEQLKGYKTIVGDLGMNGKHRNLEGLECLESIEGNLYFACTEQENLHGLEGLRRVKSLKIQGSWKLTTLKGLDSLTVIENGLEIYGAQKVKSLTGLGSLRIVGSLRFYYLPELTNLEGLKNLAVVEDDIDMKSLDYLKHTGMVNLGFVGGDLSIRKNPNLDDLQLSSLTHVGGDFRINMNKTLAQCQVENLVEQIEAADGIDGKIQIATNNTFGTCD